MASDTADDVREALAPLGSLLSKSEKAQRKLDPASWQHAMLGQNVNALRVALDLLNRPDGSPSGASRDSLEEALVALDSIIRRVERTKTFAEGTSTHSLQRNRLKALRIAHAAMQAELARR